MISSLTSTKTNFDQQPSLLNTIKEKVRELVIPIPVVKGEEKDAISSKDKAKLTLERAYSEIQSRDPESLLLISEIFTKYGRLCYEDCYPHCMVMMRASLNLQLYAIKLCNLCCIDGKTGSLAHLLNEFMDHGPFSAFDNLLLSLDIKAFSEQILNSNLDEDQIHTLGYTLYWLCNGLGHTAGFQEKDDNADRQALNHKRIDQVCFLADSLLSRLDNPKSKLELAELYYNGLSRIERRKNPESVDASHLWLDKASQINPSLHFLARVANLKSCDYAVIGNLEQAKKFLMEAIRIRESLKIEEQDPFLVANLYCRRSGFALKESNFDEAELYIAKSLEHADACRSERNPETDELLDHKNDHQYFGLYNMQMAKVKFSKKEKDLAVKHINRALDTFNFHKQDSQQLIKDAEEIKKNILNG